SCSSVIRTVLGKEAATRTPTDYFDNTSLKGWIFRLSARLSWIALPKSSILDPERLWTGRPQPMFWNQVFRRPIERKSPMSPEYTVTHQSGRASDAAWIHSTEVIRIFTLRKRSKIN